MATPSIGQLLQRSLQHAAQDRLDLADAYGHDAEAAQAALIERADILTLKGRAFRTLSEPELELARLSFLYAEQYELSVADALKGTSFLSSRKTALKNAELYRKERIARWGRTRLEVELSKGVAVPIAEVFAMARKIASANLK